MNTSTNPEDEQAIRQQNLNRIIESLIQQQHDEEITDHENDAHFGNEDVDVDEDSSDNENEEEEAGMDEGFIRDQIEDSPDAPLDYIVNEVSYEKENAANSSETNENIISVPTTRISITEKMQTKQNKNIITLNQVEKGRDVQGIPWHLLQLSRLDYRRARTQEYPNQSGLEPIDPELKSTCASQDRVKMFDFSRSFRHVKPWWYHFQLRHLLQATSSHNIFALSINNSIVHYNTLTDHVDRVLTLDESCILCSMGVDMNFQLIFAGGLKGEFTCKSLATGVELLAPARLTDAENAICNAMSFYKTPTGDPRIVVSDNDSFARSFALPSLQQCVDFRAPWAVNHSSASPDGKQMLLVGDDSDCLLYDAHTGEQTHQLTGHTGYSFSSAWHPDNIHFATASQDCTSRIWDRRNTSTSLFTLAAEMAPIRSVNFSPDGRYMYAAEAADFVTIFDCHADYKQSQVIDVFGEISGVSFTPDADCLQLFIAVKDQVYGCLLEYNAIHQTHNEGEMIEDMLLAS